MKESIVLPYIDPDLDGVACAVAIATLCSDRWSAAAIGRPDAETEMALTCCNLKFPAWDGKWSEVKRLWLVDTHHLNQLPPELPLDRVLRVTDHHPNGNPEAFVNAEIQNEEVGAAATLIFERFADRNKLTPDICHLLQSAILSNTLDFKAPSTSDRDRLAIEKLARMSELPAEIVGKLREARSEILFKRTNELVSSDSKIFAWGDQQVFINQVEAVGALEVLSRNDLRRELVAVARANNCQSALLNLVDLGANSSALIATDESILQHLGDKLGYAIGSDGIVRIDRLVQRKSDLIPNLD